MLIKVLSVASMLTVCNGVPPSYPKREESHSDQAVSSQSFKREDVPLSYEFKNVHTYQPSKLNSEEPHHTAYSHHHLPHIYDQPTHQVRQLKPQTGQYIQPAGSHALHLSHNSEKNPQKILQYAPVQHAVKNDASDKNHYFNPSTNKLVQQNQIVPYRIIYVKPTTYSGLENMPMPESGLTRGPVAHSLHLNTYQRNRYTPEDINTVGMKKVLYPQLLQMFIAQHASPNKDKHMARLSNSQLRTHSNIESTMQDHNEKHYRDQIQMPPQYRGDTAYSHQQQPKTETPQSYQFVPIKSQTHQHHPERYTDSAVQYPAHTQAIFQTNAVQPETQASEKVKITYLYPVTAPRAPTARF